MITRGTRKCDIISVIRSVIGDDPFVCFIMCRAGKFSRKASYFQKFGQCISYLIKKDPFYFVLCHAFFQVTQGHRNHNAVCDQISETGQIAFDLSFIRIPAVLLIIVIDILQNIAVEFFLSPDQGFDPALKSKCEKRIFLCHIFVKFLYPLRLRGKEVIMFEQFNDLDQEITMGKVDRVIRIDSRSFQITRILVQYFKHSIT